jgi:putative PEP-CTERM system TPR-repeat lipoprotein
MSLHLAVNRTVGTWLILGAVVLAAGCGGGNEPARLVASAKEYIAKKDPAAAAIQLKNALQQEPSNGEARFLLGTVLLEAGDPVSAEKELRRALEYNYSRGAVIPQLARAMQQLGQSKEVIGEFAVTNLDDAAAQAAIASELGYAHIALGQLKEAGDSFAAALSARPEDPRARVGQARLMAMDRDLSGAMKVVDEVLHKSPSQPDALELKVAILLAQNEREAGKQVLSQLIKVQPVNVQARYALVAMLIDERGFDKAQVELDAMKKVAPRDVRPLYLQSMISFRQGDAAKAKPPIMEVLKVAPDHLLSRLLAGSIELQLGQLDTAEDHFRKVLAAAPRSSFARALLATAYLRQGQPTKAEETIAPALRQDPNPMVLQVAGEVSLAKGDLARATSYYEKATAADKDNARLRFRLAQARLAGGDVGQGFKELESASAIDPAQYQADVALVLAHARRREYDEALAAVATLEKKQPENPLTHDLKGRVYLMKRDRDAARASFEKALTLKSDYVPAVRNLAAMDLADKQPGVGRKRYDAVLAKAPGNESALLGLAEFLIATRAPAKEVNATLERAVKANPNSASARLMLIAHLGQTKDFKGAVAAAEAARVAIPNDARILEALGAVQLAAGETTRAIATFSSLVAAQPESPGPLVRLARAQVVAKDYDAAIGSLRRAMALRPGQVELQGTIAAIQLTAGQPGEAMKEARALQAARPKDSAGFVLEGELLVNQKKYTEAVNAYSEALKRHPSVAIAMRLHSVLQLAGKQAEATKLASGWIRDHPQDIAMRLYLADAELRKKDYPAAVKGYKEILSIQPENTFALNNLAWTLGELKDPSALGYAEKAYGLAPANAAIADTFGWMLVERGDTKRGVEILAKAAEAAPEVLAIRMHYAKALLKAGDKSGARKELEVVSSASGESPLKGEAAELLKQL